MTEPQPDLRIDQFAYLHERVDQVIRQAGIEVGILEMKINDLRGAWPDKHYRDQVYDLAKKRFWMADDAAGEKFGKEPRER